MISIALTSLDDAAQMLAENVEVLNNAPAFRVRVDAYTDHVGGDQYNLRLSLRRAASVVEFYTNNGISEDRIESRGLGKAPVECAETEKEANNGCEKNRTCRIYSIKYIEIYSCNFNAFDLDPVHNHNVLGFFI